MKFFEMKVSLAARLILPLLFIFSFTKAESDSLTKKISSSISLSIYYLEGKKPIQSSYLLILLEYLERAYGLTDNFNTLKQLNVPPIYDDEKAEMKFYGRLYGQTATFTKSDIE